jgi:hypothetical protein
MAVDGTRTLRGALAGAIAAAVWAVQQPLDQRLFGVDHDDARLLGSWVARGRWVAPAGLALHVQNGALFGALYANVAPSLPGPAWVRGPLAGLVEHLATWPATSVLDRLHPAARELAPLWGSGRAFAQGAWRHLLFGAVLGQLERRLNPPQDAVPAHDVTSYSSNGHGSIEHLVETGPPSAN